MKAKKKGETVEYVVTFLEMAIRPRYPRPPMVGSVPSALIRATKPPGWYFLNLYDAVGRDYEWVDWHHAPKGELDAYLGDPAVQFFTFFRQGWPHGFFVLDTRKAGVVAIDYLGLVPEAVGKGLGTWFLQTAIFAAWDVDACEKVILNTCTLDHPRALAHYQKNGFTPVGQHTRTRVLTRDRDPTRFP